MLLMYRFPVRRDGDFFHGTLQIYEAEKQDAGKEFTSAVGTPREGYFRKRLVSVKNATAGGTIYYSKKFGNEAIEISWQANATDSGLKVDGKWVDGKWYAPKLETYFREDALKLLQRIHKRCKQRAEGGSDDITPRQILDALASDELIFVSYDSGNYDMWLPMQGEPEHLDKAPVEIPA